MSTEMLILLLWFLIEMSTSYCSVSSAENIIEHPNWPKDVQDECGISYADRIIGGKNASLGQFPWLARIGYGNFVFHVSCLIYPIFDEYVEQNRIEYECGGTLISKVFVLTAAHCVTNLPPNVDVKSIVLGENNANTDIDCDNFNVCADPIQTFGPEKIIFPSNYNYPAFRHDIALIKLNKEVKLSEWVTPICLPFGESLSLNLTNKTGEVAGWGLTNSDDDFGTPFLQTIKVPHNFKLLKQIYRQSFELSIIFYRKAYVEYVEYAEDMPIHANDKCQEMFRTLSLGQEQLCVGGVIGKDSCGGDSGGPLMMAVSGPAGPRYFVFGIVSFGTKNCGETEMPGIYTDLRYYLMWILQNFSN